VDCLVGGTDFRIRQRKTRLWRDFTTFEHPSLDLVLRIASAVTAVSSRGVDLRRGRYDLDAYGRAILESGKPQGAEVARLLA